MAKCEYAKKCPYYSEDSITCNEEPSEYCGAFKRFEKEEDEHEK